MTISPSIRDKWINEIVDLCFRAAKHGFFYEPYNSHGSFLMTYINKYSGMQVKEVVKANISELLKRSTNKGFDSGAILWRLLNKNDVGKKEDESPVLFAKMQHKIVDVLRNLPLEDVSVVAKINALDYLGYSYHTWEYRQLYNMLGKFKLGENGTDVEQEQKQTVNLFRKLLANLEKTKSKNARANYIENAKIFLETISENSEQLDAPLYIDEKEWGINEQEKSKMYGYMKDSGVSFSQNCNDYFEDINQEERLFYQEEERLFYQELDDARKKISSMQNILENINGLSEFKIKAYAKSIIDHSLRYGNDSAGKNVSFLDKLLEKNVKETNDAKRKESLFPDTENQVSVNKKLVADIAEIYEAAYSNENTHSKDNLFHKLMQEMFSRAVLKGSYNDNEVCSLTGILENSRNVHIKDVAHGIKSEYASKKSLSTAHPVFDRGGRN